MTAIWLLVFSLPLFLFTPDGKNATFTVKAVCIAGFEGSLDNGQGSEPLL